MDDEEKKGNDEIASQYVVGKMESSQYRASYNAKRDRAKYDDTAKRKKFRDEQFGNKQTIVDPYTGETLHKSTSAAKINTETKGQIFIQLRRTIQFH